MVLVEAKDYRFCYPEQEKSAVYIADWQVKKGEMHLLAGPSGCGKTTILRQLMRESGWQGTEEGNLFNHSEQTSYVWQNPEGQIITDRVAYEIVFGLENQGMQQEKMNRRLAEMVTVFGMEHLLHKNTMDLSGGEKQLLNVVSAMAMEPDLLLLDEPTSQLDPVAARRLFQLLRTIGEEYGTTIILAEQRLEEIVPFVDCMLCLEEGKVVAKGHPGQLCPKVRGTKAESFFPSYVRLLSHRAVLTKKEARMALQEEYESVERTVPPVPPILPEGGKIVGKHLSVRFEKKGTDVLQQCDFSIPHSSVTCITGGNGSGKTTLLRLLAGHIVPYTGKIKGMPSTVSCLPQNPVHLMLEETVEKELSGVDTEYQEIFGLQMFSERNPHDLSGGELQCLGLGKVLSKDADCYLLDEPTKGLDAERKKNLTSCIQKKKQEGKTVLVVSHDMEFAARTADYVGMMFDGKMVVLEQARKFFEGNRYYTTAIHRVAGQLNSHIIVEEDFERYAKKK